MGAPLKLSIVLLMSLCVAVTSLNCYQPDANGAEKSSACGLKENDKYCVITVGPTEKGGSYRKRSCETCTAAGCSFWASRSSDGKTDDHHIRCCCNNVDNCNDPTDAVMQRETAKLFAPIEKFEALRKELETDLP